MECFQLAQQLSLILEAQNLMFVTAESCTGGQVAQIITSIAGSSAWFERGFITYSNAAKEEMLGVKVETIVKYGAVSEEVATQMAEGALTHSHAQVSLAVTGIAGPAGGTAAKPVGTVSFAWAGTASSNLKTSSTTCHFQGDRNSIRSQAAEFVLQELINILQAS
ncbi:MAG: CinA family protein [Gammaproteobacteria bacterium]|nr:CinA family protein [Gammaproteobacteria bacterium]